MALFFVAATPKSATAIGAAVQEKYGAGNFSVAPGQWLVTDTGKTAEQVAKNLGIGSDPDITALVVGVGTYWGHHNRDLWPWMKEQLERRDG